MLNLKYDLNYLKPEILPTRRQETRPEPKTSKKVFPLSTWKIYISVNDLRMKMGWKMTQNTAKLSVPFEKEKKVIHTSLIKIRTNIDHK